MQDQDALALLKKLDAIEQLKQLKARYFRFLDQADIDGLQTIFTPEGGVHYRSPSYDIQHQGWDALARFFAESFTPSKFGIHNGLHPEITIESDDQASGIWYLHDIFVSLEDNIQFEGSALYKDQYRKVDGEWKIAFSEYDRLFEQITPRNDQMMITCAPVKEKQ